MTDPRRSALFLAGVLIAACSPGSRVEWLGTDELGPVRSIITVVGSVRRADDFDPAEGLVLPVDLPDGDSARVEVHGMEHSLDTLRISPGVQLGRERGALLPVPLASFAIDLNDESTGAWTPTDASAIRDLRSRFDCAPYRSELVAQPDGLSGVPFGIALDDGDLLIGVGDAGVYRYSFDRGFQRVDTPGLTHRVSAAALLSSGTLVVGDGGGAIFEARLESNTLVRTASIAVSKGWVKRLVVEREVPLELVAMANNGTQSPITGLANKEIIRVRQGEITVLESPTLDLRIERAGEHVYSFGQEGPGLRRADADRLTSVSIPAVSGVGSITELNGFGLVVGTAEGTLHWQDVNEPSGWRTVPISGAPQSGNIVESVFEWRGRLHALVRSSTNVLYELNLPDGEPCERLVGVPDMRVVPVGDRIVSFADGSLLIAHAP